MTDQTAPVLSEEDAARWIQRLLGAWDCCGTCAGGVLAERDRRIRQQAVREALAEVEALAGEWERGSRSGYHIAEYGDLFANDLRAAVARAKRAER